MKRNIFSISLIFIVILLTQTIPSFAQVEEENNFSGELIQDAGSTPAESFYDFVIIARSYGDSVVLRWAPQNAGFWRLASHYGWNIYRERTDSDVPISPDDTLFMMRLNPTPIKALTLEEMQAKYDSTHFYVGVAAQALYGPSYYNPKESEGMENYIFRREQEQTQRQAMAYLAAEGHPDAADALGLRFVDRTVKKGELYTYRIECLVPQEIAKTYTKVFDVECLPFTRNYELLIPEIRFLQNSPYTVLVFWAKNKLSGYFVERSEDKGKTWTALNDAPIYGHKPNHDTYEVYGDEIASLLEGNVGMFDSLELNKKYIYRVKAFDAFGDYSPEKKSEPFEMEDRIPPTIPVLGFVVAKDNKECTLNWTMDKYDEDLKGFLVAFSDNPDGPWDNVSELLPPNTRQWVDKNAHDRGRGLYRVFATDKSGNVSYSLSQINNIEDDVAPSAPTGLGGVVDTAGVVLLKWNENPEKDVLGYRVYFANQLDHDFMQKTGRRYQENSFWDTLSMHTLTKYIYYYVVAEDNSHNFSLPSDTLAIPVPDIVPPGAAVLKDHTQTDESVTFSWMQSTSNDVVAYVVYRKKDNEKQWKQVRIFHPEELEPGAYITFTDYPEPSATNYNYCIEVFDNSRLSSGKTGQTTVRFRGASVVQIPLTLKASLNKAKTCANLEFTYEYKSKKDYYGVIYKSVNGEPAYPCASFHRGENKYTDCTLKAGDKVTYTVQMFLGAGKRSQVSKEATVKP